MSIRTRGKTAVATVTAVALILGGSLTACGSDDGNTTTEQSTGAGDGAWPVTVSMADNGGQSIDQTIPEDPQRVVAIGQNIAELMISFGLRDRVVGVGYLDGADSYYKDDLNALPTISEQVPSTESVMALKPDLIISMSFAMTEENMGTADTWNSRGVPVLLVDNYTVGRDLDSYFGDIRNIGAAFGIGEQTDAYIDREKKTMDEIARRNRGTTERPRVLLVASGGSNKLTYNYYSPSLGLADEMVEAARGEYVKVSDGVSAEMSDEMILKANPDVIVMTQFQKSSSAAEMDKLMSNPRLRKVKAVQDGRVMLLDYSTTVRGTPHLGELTEQLSDFIHADGEWQ
ncbi:ABC transporter substrate-binding protein [uncultured Corynebacterium sp.]|uniref:ABC transporter substrate-binding protein n=1 Tax=uncultured Corynebacterium sp. TaxID=159447 RepID=UPI0025E1D4A8|nr:ABC transporter substrate-binding protein [uncultured Corynebacterium sp.]